MVLPNSQIYISNSPEETLEVARRFASSIQGGGLVALRGELGAGKTCFAKGIISELSKVDVHEITSPTFTLIEEYFGTNKIYHLDLYRITHAKEAEALPWDELFDSHTLTLVEWPEHLRDLLSHCQFEVLLSKAGPFQRKIEILVKEEI
jgi:tRNA threonylcarbamoyladenosine biosynthesis protein TsaE